jgi:hypothetical protein
MRTLFLLSSICLVSCGLGTTDASGPKTSGTGVPVTEFQKSNMSHHQNSSDDDDDDDDFKPAKVLAASRQVGNKSQLDWSKEWWRWILSIPAAQNPELVLDVNCGQSQQGPVFYLPGFSADVYTRTCNIPEGKFVLAPVWTILNDFPCPDPSFTPGPNQTLEQFLQQGAAQFLARVTNIQVTLDGQLVDFTTHRLTSGLFNFTSHRRLILALQVKRSPLLPMAGG